MDNIELEIKKIQKNIDSFDKNLNILRNLINSDSIKSMFSGKCQYCGCYDGIHRKDCLFMSKYLSNSF